MIRLYDQVWVKVKGEHSPHQALRDAKRPDRFFVNGHTYDIDGRNCSEEAPCIEGILSLQAIRELGLRLHA